MRLKDKVIIVTGSTTGIGKAIALRCIKEGAKVVFLLSVGIRSIVFKLIHPYIL